MVECPHCHGRTDASSVRDGLCPTCGGRIEEGPPEAVDDAGQGPSEKPEAASEEAAESPPEESLLAGIELPPLAARKQHWTAGSFVWWGPPLCLLASLIGSDHCFAPLTYPVGLVALVMGRLLDLFHSAVGDYGLSLVLLALVVRWALQPFLARLNRQAEMMGRVNLQMARLREVYGNDKERLAKAQVELCRKHGTRPLGCLLGLIATVLAVGAVLRMIRRAFELQGSSFLWGSTWIADLSQPDRLFAFGRSVLWLGAHFNLLPVLSAAAGSLLILWGWRRAPGPGSAAAGRIRTIKAKPAEQLILWLLLCLIFWYKASAGRWIFALSLFGWDLLIQRVAGAFLWRYRPAEAATPAAGAAASAGDERSLGPGEPAGPGELPVADAQGARTGRGVLKAIGPVLLVGLLFASSFTPDKDAAHYYGRGNAYFREGDLDAAIRAYTRAIELRPRYAAAYCNRAATYGKNGEYDAALRDAAKAVELSPQVAQPYVTRGCVYLYRGDYDAAVQDYTTALRLEPQYADAYYNRAIAHARKEDYVAAWADVRACRKLGGKVDPEFLAGLRTASGREE